MPVGMRPALSACDPPRNAPECLPRAGIEGRPILVGGQEVGRAVHSGAVTVARRVLHQHAPFMNKSHRPHHEHPARAECGPLDPSLKDLAQAHHGMLTTAMARTFGLDKESLASLVRHGILLHPGRGLYAVAELVDQRPEQWHLHLAYGATLLYPDVSFTSTTALLAHGITIWRSPLDKPFLVRPIDRSASMASFTVRPRQAASIGSPWGPTEPLATAVVQHCLDNGIAQGLVSADHALHTGRVTLPELRSVASTVARWPRYSRVKSMMTFVSPEHETPGESLTNMGCAAYGIELVPQVRIYEEDGRLVARADFVVKGTNLVVEFDGKVKYTERGVLWDEKTREDRLRSLGFVVVRITWSDIMAGARAIVAKVRAGMRHPDFRHVDHGAAA